MDYNPPNPNDDHNQHPPRRNPHLSINKLSHKISKPSNSIQTQKPPLDPPPPPMNPNPPPVYNISKSDFRDMVQKLTGPPPGELAEMSRAQHALKPPPPSSASTRLHRIRPPPLAQLTSFVSPLGNQNHQNGSGQPMNQSQSSGLTGFVRSGGPLSPLPPFPTVHTAAESPISAYMRHLRGGDSEPRRLSGFSPRWRGQDELGSHPPSSPLGFGCLPSPTAGQLGFPLSPTGKP